MKSIVAIVSVLLLSFFALAANDVTAPAQGDSWCKDQTQTIRWTPSAFPANSVKLVLFKGTQRLFAISESAPNSGQFAWKPPHSLLEGQLYRVRVRSLDDSVVGHSGDFSLKNCGVIAANDPTRAVEAKKPQATLTQSGPTLQTVDFEMLDVERETGSGVIFAKLRNKGTRAFDGPLTFQVFFGNDALDPITVPVNLAAGATTRANLMYYLQPRELAVRGSVLLRVVADFGNKVGELNEQNNTAGRTITKTCPVYIDSFQIDISPSHSTGPYPLPVNMTLRFQVIGQGELEIKHAAINNSSGTNKFQFPASGSYVFNVSQPDVLAAWLVPNAQKPNCRWENAICPLVYAWVVGACADGGMVRSNEVPTRYELPQ